RLPKDEKTKAIWFAFIGHEINVNSGICSKHFKQSDFIYKIYGDGIRRFLKQGAFPSIQFSSDIRENLKDELSEDINNCISSRTERDTDPEKNITIKEEQECIIIDETVIKAENSMEGDVQSIRKTSNSLATRKRFHNVRYVGDLCRQDFTSDESWRLFKNYLASTKTKIKSLNHKIVYLNKKIDSLQKINCF
ncbi:hypothetical protein ALC60_09347, partial [Trachymyrmex zeteki]